MVFVRSFPIRTVGQTYCIWIPHEWGVQKGDMLHIEMMIGGKVFHHTTRAQFNSSIYCTLPKVWPIHKGDIYDTRVNYARVPVRPEPAPQAESSEPAGDKTDIVRNE